MPQPPLKLSAAMGLNYEQSDVSQSISEPLEKLLKSGMTPSPPFLNLECGWDDSNSKNHHGSQGNLENGRYMLG